jgi:hypothetical protein
MRICYADFESYWSTTHSLTKMNAIDYVMHPDTEIISLAAKFDDGETHCVFGEDKIANLLSRIDWSDVMLVGHNMSGFDAMIFAWRFGVKPKLWGCTLAMARPFFQTTVGGSLKKVAAELEVGVKGDLEATNTKGKHLKDFTPWELTAMEEYNKLDVELCAGIFKKLAPLTTKQEIQLIDATVRMLVEPEFDLDVDLLETTLLEEQKTKELMLLDIATMTGAYVPGMDDESVAAAVKKVLASAPKFAALLRDLGVEPPVKPSPTNPEKTVYALAKTDEAFLRLQEHADPIVAATARARLGVKSTLLESRITQFLAAGTALNNKMPIFLNYYAATTGRWGGSGGLNQQNMPRIPRDKDGNIIHKPTNALRLSLRAPKGKKVVVVDLSGIELRVNHFLWRAESSTELFIEDPEKADLYKDFASKLYNVPVAEVTKAQRQIGKIAHLGLGYGAGANTFVTIAKTMGGVDISADEAARVVRQWRSEYKAIKDGWKRCGSALAHIYNNDYGVPIDPWGFCVTAQGGIKTPTGMIRYPKLTYKEDAAEFWYGEGRNHVRINGPKVDENCIAAGTAVLTDNGWKPIETVLTSDKVHDGVEFVAHGGVVRKSVQECIAVDGVFMTPDHEVLNAAQKWTPASELRRPYRPDLRGIDCGVVQQNIAERRVVDIQMPMRGNAREAAPGRCQGDSSRRNPELWVHDAPVDRGEERHARHDKTPSVRGIPQYARSLPSTLAQGMEKLRGARNFCVRSLAGLVRAVLGGYGSDVRARARLRPQGQQRPLLAGELPVGISQSEYAEQTEQLRSGYSYDGDGNRNRPVHVVLPAAERAPHERSGRQAQSYEVFDILNAGPQHRFVVRGAEGPLIVHNCVQHLSRGIMAEQLLKIRKQYKVVHTVHDELVVIVDENQAEECLQFMLTTMRSSPAWWPEIRLWAEGDIADSYGQAK